MINYEKVNSPFYTENKNYCEEIESQLKTINQECEGFCNAFGYELETKIEKNNLSYELKFSKSQTTQNGVIIPVNAHVYAGIEMVVSGLNKKYQITRNKSLLSKMFSSDEFETKISEDDLLSFNYTPESDFYENLVKKIQQHHISEFKLNNGKLVLKIHTPEKNLMNLISDIEEIAGNLK